MSAPVDDPPDNVTPLKLAFSQPDKVIKARKKTGKTAAPAAGGGGKGVPPFARKPPPDVLPPDSPVKALGKFGLTYYFLDRSGQFIEMQAKDLGRLNILALFGSDKYLVQHWPAFDKNGEPNGEFKHGRLGPALIESCELMGLFDPAERVRGPGTWVDDEGKLIFHCGDVLWEDGLRAGTGLRGRYLYPGAPPLPEPILKAKALDAASQLQDMVETWNFARGEVDARLIVGFVGAAMLGAAPPWRPAIWVTGNRGTGKSTLLKLVKWVLGRLGMITSADATRAGIAQRVANSSRPVGIDELEATDDNRRAKDIIALARIASSGDDVMRGSPGGQAVSFTVRNCFLFSSIIIPPLRPADRSRMAIIELRPIARRLADDARPATDEDDDDPLLGDREKWEKVGRQLRGRLIAGWARYRETYRAYRRALQDMGHDARGADQFGALGAAYDLLMFDALSEAAAKAWAAALPAKSLAETSGSESDEGECLAHLLAATPMTIRGGSNETVAHWLRKAREDLEVNTLEEKSDALRTLAKIGIRLYAASGVLIGNEAPRWEIAIANTHDGLAKLFAGTQWASTAGSSSAWPQMFKRLPGAAWRNDEDEPIRLRIDGQRKYVTVLPWDAAFPPMDSTEDRDELTRVSGKQRTLDTYNSYKD